MERDLFLWILVGLVLGVASKSLLPGREPGGFVAALLLGIAGALGGGFLLLTSRGAAPPLHLSVIAAAAGAAVLLILYRVVIRARTH